MIYKYYSFILTFILVGFANMLFANNIQLSNISLNNKNGAEKVVYISFDVSWDNSWRSSNEAANWDAAWVFVKFRFGKGEWQHASLSTISSDHIAPVGSTIDAVNNATGIYIYRSANGNGQNNWSGVELKWNYGLDNFPEDVSDMEIKLFGFEMVYVPQGAFYVGDGSERGRLWDANQTDVEPGLIGANPTLLKCTDPPTIYDDDQLRFQGVYVDGDGGISIDGNSSVENSDFPTGYGAFYCMRYEITNQQYVDFLNTLTRAQQNIRTNYGDISGSTITSAFPMNETGEIENRNCVTYKIDTENPDGPVYFFCDLNDNGIENEATDGKYIGCINIGWADGAAYSDWAGMRPMTELEFEKACRGPIYPVADEFAWGTAQKYGYHPTFENQYVFATTDTVAMVSSYPTNPGLGTYGNATWAWTTGHSTAHNAPLRTGIFATSTSDRVNSGASYYGIMDLSGGITERTVSIGDNQGRAFGGTNGDGKLNSITANATNVDWPGIISGEESDGVKSKKGSGLRGGDWNDGINAIRVSNRDLAGKDPYSVHGTSNIGVGYRCVRTAE